MTICGICRGCDLGVGVLAAEYVKKRFWTLSERRMDLER